jgi:hypothetical protein
LIGGSAGPRADLDFVTKKKKDFAAPNTLLHNWKNLGLKPKIVYTKMISNAHLIFGNEARFLM